MVCCLGLAAQTGDSLWQAVRIHPWLTSHNAAPLVTYDGRNVTCVELSLTGAKGGLTDFSGSPTSHNADASIESFFRLTPRTMVYGAMSYDNFSGDDMAGSAFLTSHLSPLTSHLSPQKHLPFDLVEDSLVNTGRKHSDTYRLAGAFGYDLYRGIALGARIDFAAANYAKYKDLRHKNKMMDMRLSAGIYMPLTSWLDIGADYIYHRNIESVTFSTYGKTDRNYMTLISYAAFMGHVEQFGGAGYTDQSREMPLVSDANGAGLQFSITPIRSRVSDGIPVGSTSAPLRMYNSIYYMHSKGYYGRKSPYTITYTNHKSDIYHYDGQISVATQQSQFYLGFSLNAEKMQNAANTYRGVQNETGATYYEYYTPVKNSDKLWVDGSLILTADLSTLYTLQAGFNWHHRHHTAYLYPYYRRQRFTAREFFLSVGRSFVVSKGLLSFTLDGAFQKGSGEPYEDLTFAAPSDKQTAPASMDAYLWREYQWLCAPQYTVGGNMKYAFLFPTTSLNTYVRIALHHRKANNTYEYSQGRDRTTATLAVGCNF